MFHGKNIFDIVTRILTAYSILRYTAKMYMYFLCHHKVGALDFYLSVYHMYLCTNKNLVYPTPPTVMKRLWPNFTDFGILFVFRNINNFTTVG